jgi:hypothetical protein
MYMVSRYGGYGRGVWTSIENGSVEIRQKGSRKKITVHSGIIESVTDWTKSKRTTLRYGQELTVKKKGKVVYQELYDNNTLQGKRKGGLWKRQKGFPLCGTKGTLECYSTSSGACGKEVFTYDNHVVGYTAARWQKKLVIYRPSGKLWMIVKGKPHVSRNPIAEQLRNVDRDFNLWRFMDGDNWELMIYDKAGKTAVTQGQFKNRQKEGQWLENGKVCYYMAGVRVSRSLYEESPAKWNPHELLRVPNAQLRCSLLGRFGYDRLLEKVESRIIETVSDGGQLVEIDTGKTADRNLDPMMRLIKVICPSTGQSYILRVPPEMEKFEQARQWTFGLRQDNIRNGELLEFIKET